MSQTVTVPEAIAEVAAKVRAGDLTSAKGHARTLLQIADTHAFEVITTCVTILETRPKIARAKLAAYWKRSGPTARAIIEACAPKKDDRVRKQVTEPAPVPQWNERNKYQAPRDERREIRPELRRRRDQRQVRQDNRARQVIEKYQAERGGVDDAPERTENPAYSIDYDKAAVHVLRGTPCVHCWIERPEDDYTASTDDGLCPECRERDCPGIPTLPHGHTRADAIAARCAYIADHYGPSSAKAILTREWKAATWRDRTVIAAWVRANPSTIEQAAEPGAVAEPKPKPAAVAEPTPKPAAVAEPCECGSIRQVRNGHCVDCRKLYADDNAAVAA